MLTNSNEDKKARLDELIQTIKCVFASTFHQKAKDYMKATSYRLEEEKMAVILQEIVGQNRDGYFYPVFSGLARSYNFYSIGHIKPEEGIAYVAVGLGKTVMEGENCLFFSPANPKVLPQFSGTADYLKNTQRDFFAVNMNKPVSIIVETMACD